LNGGGVLSVVGQLVSQKPFVKVKALEGVVTTLVPVSKALLSGAQLPKEDTVISAYYVDKVRARGEVCLVVDGGRRWGLSRYVKGRPGCRDRMLVPFLP
jgi:hypothetical protein